MPRAGWALVGLLLGIGSAGALGCGCAPAGAAAWLPRAEVGAEIVELRATAARARTARAWRLRAELTWTLDRPVPPPSPPPPPGLEVRAAGRSPACVVARVCAWERGARRRALARLSEGGRR